ncbi:trypsin-like peptidase domain-containing protein [Myxococcus sp. CA051A]|uniref:Trypsin-like peptidase domain-containing protein n=1 Tax=Myxococcus llanfairpwllgwyngyllgogerychwyrndrobwllllantysiliogogogochensis TaxID=2590453 RepID=A0A540WWX5_9BACT|nr:MULTISPECIES: serine protease [Myxococcus]NTX02308.1 trypsin-like peptidase domain-containing protein [Myxococcus sp. CA040A]NTX16562.1 trypsin-like peptidase domain-containing protein [Myxococcus sp. CA056]NTX57003.1 trypsin-like peptidase domain-containing protein [Myxococcus sp. CA039A]NTX63975.1 trypsin-like peptidase domain-containing protein [Myxococcus sp. CA051A]TQF13493.1 trypsin-like peptidase domain-containing protein [Myxococcus llanfairpwllgwyngyllgogerychwyrndrobwllllantysilio
MTRFLLGAPVALLALASCAGAPASPASAPVPQAPPEVVRVSTPEPSRPTRKEMVRRILPHNVRLQITEADKVRRTASGVVVGSERSAEGVVAWVITNAHAVVMDDLKAPTLNVLVDRRADVESHVGQVVATGQVPDLDLALVKVPGLALPAVELADEAELELGEDVVVAASPYGRALSLSGGMLSQVEWDRESRRPRMVKTDAPIGYGASGGGIFSLESGRLLAIVEGYRTAQVDFAVREESYSFDVPMPGETFAAPSTKVRQFLQAKGFGRLLERSLPGEGGVAHAAGR